MSRDYVMPLAHFQVDMVRKLRQGSRNKPTWHKIDIQDLFDRLGDEVDELKEAVDCNIALDIIDEAADVANFCMMIADKARGNCNERKK